MEVRYTTAPEGDAYCWCVFEPDRPDDPVQFEGFLRPTLRDHLGRAAQIARFTGKCTQIAELLAPNDGTAERILLLGLGKRGHADTNTWRDAGARAVRHCLTSGATNLCLIGAVNAETAASLALGVRLGAYRFDRYRTNLPEDKKLTLTSVTITAPDVADAKVKDIDGAAVAEGVLLARSLVSEPPNILHPEEFSSRIEALRETGLKVEVLDQDALEELRMEAMLAVGRGSVHGSRLCILSWQGVPESDAAPLVTIGKGLTFDSGGISIKPAANMEAMKGDMAGAAAVVGAMVALARRKAKANVVGIVGLAENMPDGAAFRPGDILTSASGKTIEIVNTDAEGRLVLCDLLHFAQQRFKPHTIISVATLTGAIVIALGHEHAGLFSNSDELASKIAEAGHAVDEPGWRLPLSQKYDRLIDSHFADMKNSASGGAGSITAAQFLQRFVDEGVAWAHLDIAGTAWKGTREKPAEPMWATGYGVELLNRLVADHWEGT